MTNSEIFTQKTGKKYLFNIALIDNIDSIVRNGIMSYELTAGLPHISVALNSVQDRREHVQIPHGYRLHQYANLYFTFNNAMLYKRKDKAEDLCVLAIKCSVLDIDECVVTDRNAATDLVKFYPPEKGIEEIDFDRVYAQYWTHDDPYETKNHKAIKCAEVLVPNRIPYLYVAGAYVVSEEAKIKMINKGFDRKIVINKSVFYR